MRHAAPGDRSLAGSRLYEPGSLLHPDDGGLFVYEAPSLEAAQRLVNDDPYILEGCITGHRLREYQIHGANAALLRVIG